LTLCHCYGIEASDATSNQQNTEKRKADGATFAKVLYGRKQPIRGLWIRGTRYYARLSVENPISGIKKNQRAPLITKEGNPVQTVAQAMAELKRLQTQRSDNTLPTLARTPKFDDYSARYLDFIGSGQGTKKPGTVAKEKAILKRWRNFIGSLRLDQIKRVHVNRFIEIRLKENVSPRTINLDVIVLRVVCKRALSDGLIHRLPTEGLRPLKTSTKKRSLFTTADLDKLCKTAFETKLNKNGGDVPITENAQEFMDYLLILTGQNAGDHYDLILDTPITLLNKG